MKDFFCSGLAKALNHYLHLDPDSLNRLKKLEGKIATIVWPALHFVFQCRFSADSVLISADEIEVSDVKISGTPWEMFNMMLAKDRQHFFIDTLKIEGDAVLGQQVLALFDEMQWDGEEYLSRFVGDVPAHYLGRAGKQIQTIWQQINRSFTESLSEYWQEEINWFPSREAINDLFTDIDTLRMDVDRMAARLQLFMQQNENIKNMEKQ
jgi:ubiquinone biosynthesis protein UbiJ